MKHLKTLLAALALTCAGGAWAQSVGDVITVDGKNYKVTGENLITNGSFDDGVDGWYAGAWADAVISNYTWSETGGFDNGAYLTVSAGGASATTNLRMKANVTTGETYLFRVYTSGSAPTSANLQYSFLAYYDESKSNYEGDKLYELKWGASDVWTENNFVFTPTGSAVCYRTSWTSGAKVDGFFLGTVELTVSDEDFAAIVQAAKDVLNDDEYANITGEERTVFAQAIADNEGASASGYADAVKAIEAAENAFKAAKSAYEAFAAAKETTDPALAYASDAKKEAFAAAKNADAAASAADATAKTEAIVVALRAYYESHAMAEGVEGAVNYTSTILNNDANDGNNSWTWTGNKNNPRNAESWTDSEGNASYMYFDGGNWNATGWTTTMKQDITVPAGKYLLTAKGRASDQVTLTLLAGENNAAMSNVNASGNVFNRGWGDTSVEFESEGEPLTIGVEATTTGNHQWFSASNFRLVQLEKYVIPMADADDYAALTTAIETAEANTLGFAVGEYAPYNNTAALVALAAAKAIDTEAENTKKYVNETTDALTAATWTANETDVDAIYDGQFANTPANATSGDINLPGWTMVTGIRLLVKDEATDPGLAYTDGKAAVFTWGGTTITYGAQTGYTLPLPAYSIHEVSFKVSGWRDGDLPSKVSVTVKKGDETVYTKTVTPTVARINVAEGNPFASLSFKFKTAEAGNYTIEFYGNQHITYADFSLVKSAADEVVLSETDTEDPVASEIANVTVNRTLKADQWNTLVLPFNYAIPAGWEVKTLDAAEASEDPNYEGTINVTFADAAAIEAGKPYIVKPAAAVTKIEAEEVELTAALNNVTVGNVTFAGNYAAGIVAEGAYFVSGGKFYLADKDDIAIKGFRAVMTVASAAKLNFIINGEVVTSINGLNVVNAENAPVYNLNGVRMNGNLQKGIYIQNGKKVVVK